MHTRATAAESTGWTDERVETLKKLWHQGLSASQIAGELGVDITRNAVIGKVHRLKLSARSKPTSSRNAAPRNRRQGPAASATPTPRQSSNRRLPTGNNPAFNPAFTSPKPNMPLLAESLPGEDMSVYMAPAAAELFIPEEKRLNLQQLNEHTCKWPIGDPLAQDFYFCGQHSLNSGPYCEFHSRRAYHQLDKKRGGGRKPRPSFKDDTNEAYFASA